MADIEKAKVVSLREACRSYSEIKKEAGPSEGTIKTIIWRSKEFKNPMGRFKNPGRRFRLGIKNTKLFHIENNPQTITALGIFRSFCKTTILNSNR